MPTLVGGPPKTVESPLPGLMSLTSLVPAAVPFDFQSSRPWLPSSALKKSDPSASARSKGEESTPFWLMSLTSVVPPGVPSDVQSS